MIASISKGNSSVGLIRYHEQKISQGTADVLGFANLISIDAAKNTFNMLNSLNRNVSEPTFHVSLNLSPGENVNDDKFMQIAHEYMNEMGYQDQPYYVVRHTDKLHEHVHIISTRIDWDGKAISDSNIRYRSMNASKRIEKQFNLTPVNHTLNKEKTTIYKADIERIKGNKALTKNHINSVTKELLKQNKYVDISQYISDLGKYNIAIKEHETKSKGKTVSGLIYYLTNDNGERYSKGIAASSMMHKPTKAKLEAQFIANNKYKKLHKSEVKNGLLFLIKNYDFLSFKQFENTLSRKGIQAIYEHNSSGIYGIKFYDKKTKLTFKGSEIGLSWNKLKNILNDSYTIKAGEKNKFVNTIYNRLRKENLKKDFFEYQFLQSNTNSLSEQINLLVNSSLVRDSIQENIKEYVSNKIDNIENIKEREYKHFLAGFNNYVRENLTDNLLHASMLLNCFYTKRNSIDNTDVFNHLRSDDFIVKDDSLNYLKNNSKYNYCNSLFLKHFNSDYKTRNNVRDAIISMQSNDYKKMPIEMFYNAKMSYSKNMFLHLFERNMDHTKFDILSTQSYLEKTFNKYSVQTNDVQYLLLYLASHGIKLEQAADNRYYLQIKDKPEIVMYFNDKNNLTWGNRLNNLDLGTINETLNQVNSNMYISSLFNSGAIELPEETIVKELGLEYAVKQLNVLTSGQKQTNDQTKQFNDHLESFESEFTSNYKEGYSIHIGEGEEQYLGNNPFDYSDSSDGSYEQNENELKRKKPGKKKKRR